jgi:hypothetical protein
VSTYSVRGGGWRAEHEDIVMLCMDRSQGMGECEVVSGEKLSYHNVSGSFTRTTW